MSLKDTLSAKEKKNKEVHNIFIANKKTNGNSKTITYKIKFIDNIRFMGSLRSSGTDNLVERLHKAKC